MVNKGGFRNPQKGFLFELFHGHRGSLGQGVLFWENKNKTVGDIGNVNKFILFLLFLAFAEEPFEGFETPDGPITVPCIAGEGMAPELDSSKDYTGSILPSGGHIAVRTGADQAWVDENVEISKAVWADPEFSDWIEEIMLNKRELYGDDAKNFMDKNCKKAVKAYEILSDKIKAA